MFEDDRQLQETINNIKESISAGFDAASQYASTFEVYREFYSENERLDLDAFRNENDGMNLITFLFLSIILHRSNSFLNSSSDRG